PAGLLLEAIFNFDWIEYEAVFMAEQVTKEQLIELTEKLVRDYFDHDNMEGISDILAEDAIAYGPVIPNFARGSWNVRQVLRQEYERLMPCTVEKIKFRMIDYEEEKTVLSSVLLNSTQYTHIIFMRMAFMYKLMDDGKIILNGIHMSRDYHHENAYNALNPTSEAHSLEHLTSFDELTGLYNKQAFYDKTYDMLMENKDKEFCILRINIERFKVLNDLFGEDVGDKLLRYIGRFLRDVNLPLCVSGRLYADNFAMCFEMGHGNDMRLIKTLQMMADSFAINYRTVLCFGLYKMEDKTLPISVMCDRANLALNRAKGNFQTPYCVYDDNMRQQMVMEQKIVNAMESAIENKEFTLYLQPKYEIINETLIGAEALVRWNSKTGGFISPADFIPVFEKNGFVYDVDKFIWEETCRCLRRWLDEGKRVVPVSVNVSRIDLYDPMLVDYLVELREQYRIPEDLLELEITESAYTEDPDQIIATTSQLSKAGFMILMDDFGSGYSSLTSLKKMHIDILKLDMGFLNSKDESVKGGNILAAIMQMAHSLNMQTIAEGVETKEQVDFLRSIGCQWVQGYYYSRPLPVADYEKLL
ncbi:MAG: GGDEF domain-containing protein, partial [Selenomonadaceae bacterium]|nr:GGDEF domain-containing protein [Selenomonadaceae bacterium]